MKIPHTPTTELTLPCGMRAVHMRIAGATAGYFGVAVRAGSRDEDVADGQAGLAHFVEHTIFKGTDRRRSWHIINRMEAVGGEINAFTTKQDTVVYAAFARGNMDRAMELIADLTRNSRFPKREIDREREVVADEINSYLDQPSEAVFDDFEDIAFAGTPLGHNILGTVKSLAGFDSDMCRRWLTDHYTAGRMVLFYAGAVGVDSFMRRASIHFDPWPITSPISKANPPLFSHPSSLIFQEHRAIDSHQSHTVVGKVLPKLGDEQRTTMALLTNILGGPGMNSLLNVALRERRGLVYSVDASTSMFTDCGLFAVYYGCDPADSLKCRELVTRQINDLADRQLSARRLAAAKKQYLGQLTLANENLENHAIAVARATLLRGHALSARQIVDAVNAVTPAMLQQASQMLTEPSSLTLGPANC